LKLRAQEKRGLETVIVIRGKGLIAATLGWNGASGKPAKLQVFAAVQRNGTISLSKHLPDRNRRLFEQRRLADCDLRGGAARRERQAKIQNVADVQDDS
jgi:hypothetical protein